MGQRPERQGSIQIFRVRAQRCNFVLVIMPDFEKEFHHFKIEFCLLCFQRTTHFHLFRLTKVVDAVQVQKIEFQEGKWSF